MVVGVACEAMIQGQYLNFFVVQFGKSTVCYSELCERAA